jgi:hypothetical protein
MSRQSPNVISHDKPDCDEMLNRRQIVPIRQHLKTRIMHLNAQTPRPALAEHKVAPRLSGTIEVFHE